MINPFKRFVFLILSVLSIVFNGFGQDKKSYSGPLQIGRYSGDAVFEYAISGKDTIYDGNFEFQKSNLETALQKRDTSFLFQGDFDKGTATGPWQFQFNVFESKRQGKLVDFEYRLLVSGVQEEGSGEITNGQPDGIWVYQVNEIEDSEIASVLFKSEINFDAGIPQQNFKIESDSMVMVGRFLRDGLAHDEWSAFDSHSVEDTESWFFDDGILQRIVRVKDGASNEISVFEGTDTTFKAIPLDGNYLSIVKSAVLAKSDSLRPKKGISDLLARNEGYYQKLNLILTNLGSGGFTPEYQAKVPYYPLDSIKLKQLKAIAEDWDVANGIASLILTNGHLNIVKRSDAEVNFRYETVAAIQRRFLDPLTYLVTAQQEGIIEYLELSKAMGELWPDGKPAKRISIQMDSIEPRRTFELSNANEFDFSGDDLNAIHQITAYARAGMENIGEALSDQLTTEESLQALNSLEAALIAKNDSLISVVDASQKKLPSKYSKSLEGIINFAETSLRDYAATTNPEEKLVNGNLLNTCMENLLRLTKAVGNLPAKITEIDSLYTDDVWNPFMANIMEEEVKKRITNAYSDIVIPYFLERTAREISCDNAEEITIRLNNVHKRVVSLRDKDTKKLERKLRREKDPEKVLRLLELSATIKAEKE